MFGNLDDPQKQLMLMLGAGLLSPVRNKGFAGFGEALSQGIQGGLLGYNKARQMQDQRGHSDLQRKMQEMQLAEMERGQKFNQVAFRPGIGAPPATPNDDNGYPMPSNEPRFDFAAAAAVDPMRAYQLRQSMNKAEAPLILQKDAVALDPVTKQPIYTNRAPEKPVFHPGQTREIKSGRTIYTQEYQPDGSWKQIGKSAIDAPEKPDKGPAAPQGYRWNGDRLEPIPGGPADAKVGKEAEALAKRQEGALQRADFVLGKVREAIDKTGFTTAGTIGAVMKNVPGSGAKSLQRAIDPIKANIGFAELQAMREASPTGGALGQVAVQELNMLQSVLGSLEQDQQPDDLLKTLYAIEKHYKGWKRAVTQAQQGQQATPAGNSDPLGLRGK